MSTSYYVPCVVVLCGPPLHGKTEIARSIEARTNFIAYDVDEVRRCLFPETSGIALPEAEEIRVMTDSFAHMMKEADASIRRGTPVLLPSTFSRAVFKQFIVEYAGERAEIPVAVVRLEVLSRAVIRERLKKRLSEGSFSNVLTMERYEWSLTIIEPWPRIVPIITVMAERSVEDVTQEVLLHLRSLTSN